MEKQWSTVDVLRHARHDWLNKLQLIKGNLDLNKPERVKQIIEEIVIESQQEAKLSNLKIPLFASLLLTANWEAYPFQVEFEVIDGTQCSNLDDELLEEWTKSFLNCLRAVADVYTDNSLSCSIETQKNGIRFFFDFCGIIKDRENLSMFLDMNGNKEPLIKVLQFTQEELAIEVFMPFK